MAGMKETPRQKMIGMMYLVLTALLALQVSDALIQKFAILNNSLEQANTSAGDKNKTTLKGIDAKVKEDGVSKYGDILNKANQVHKLADDMVSEIDVIKGRIVEEAGEGIDPETGGIKNMKETEKVGAILVGTNSNKNGVAYTLKTKLETYLTKLTGYADKGTTFKPMFLDAKDDPTVSKDANQNGKDFAELNFSETPVPAALATLSQKQSEVRRYEADVLKQLADKVGIKEVKFDQVFAAISAQANTVVAGMDYEAELFIAATSSSFSPRMSINGSGLVIKDGRGQIKFKTSGGEYDKNGLSKKSYTASVTYQSPEGAKTESITKEYFVLKPSYTIETATLPALYFSCANRLQFVSPGLGALWNPSFTADNADAIPGERGKVTIVPSGATCAINVTNGGIMLGTNRFNVRRVPKPDVKVFGNGGELDEKRGALASGLRSIEARATADESFKATNPEDANYRVSELYVALARGQRKIKDVTLNGGGSISALAQEAQAGDRYYIEVKGVQRKNFRGQIENIPFERKYIIPLN
jgi:gliding motility-associated protein GldM